GEVAGRGAVVVINKLDLPETRALRARGGHPDALWCSALTGEGVPEVLASIDDMVAAAPLPPQVEVPPPVHRLRPRRTPAEPPLVERHPWGFLVSGEAVGRLGAGTRVGAETGLSRVP